MIKRLFIESDVLQEDELHTSQRTVALILDKNKIEYDKENVFEKIVDFAWHEPGKAWEAVKWADEIYAWSGLVPLAGYGSYTGAPVVMDVMMGKAIAENVTGKSLIFLREYDDVDWDQIDRKLISKAFKNNKLFTLENDDEIGQYFKEVNIQKLYKSLK